MGTLKLLLSFARLRSGLRLEPRLRAARALGQSSHPRAVRLLASALRKEGQPPGDSREPRGIEKALIEALGATRAAEAVQALVASCCHPRIAWCAPRVTATHAAALRQIGAERAVPALVKILGSDAGVSMRRAAALALGQVPSAAAKEALLRALADPDVQAAALDVLGEFPCADKAATEALARVLSQHNRALVGNDVQPVLKRALDLLEQAGAVEAIAGAVQHRHPATRIAAVEALERLRAPQAAAPLLDKFLQAEIVGDAWHRKLAGALVACGWSPGNNTQRVYLAIAGQDWNALADLGDVAVDGVERIFREKYVAEELETAVLRTLLRMGEHALGPLRSLLDCDRLYDVSRSGVLGTLERLASILSAGHDYLALGPLQEAKGRVERLMGLDPSVKQRVQRWIAKSIDEIRLLCRT